ncbi:MAG: hypothetical protein AB8B16_08890, partial [Prochlorococcus sp.]
VVGSSVAKTKLNIKAAPVPVEAANGRGICRDFFALKRQPLIRVERCNRGVLAGNCHGSFLPILELYGGLKQK